jgi:pentatricopeptide repeat protein
MAPTQATATAATTLQWEQSLRLLDTMRAGGEATTPDAWSYSAAMRACDKGGQPSAALRLFETMQQEGRARVRARGRARVRARGRCPLFETMQQEGRAARTLTLTLALTPSLTLTLTPSLTLTLTLTSNPNPGPNL